MICLGYGVFSPCTQEAQPEILKERDPMHSLLCMSQPIMYSVMSSECERGVTCRQENKEE